MSQSFKGHDLDKIIDAIDAVLYAVRAGEIVPDTPAHLQMILDLHELRLEIRFLIREENKEQ